MHSGVEVSWTITVVPLLWDLHSPCYETVCPMLSLNSLYKYPISLRGPKVWCLGYSQKRGTTVFTALSAERNHQKTKLEKRYWCYLIAASSNALVISCGYQCTHVLPVLDGRFQAQYCRRIGLGGSHLDSFMQRLLQLKYPGHQAAITLSRAEVSGFYSLPWCSDWVMCPLAWCSHTYCYNMHRYVYTFYRSARAVSSFTHFELICKHHNITTLYCIETRLRQLPFVGGYYILKSDSHTGGTIWIPCL